MGVYIGSNKIKVNINGTLYKFNLSSPITNGVALKSSDNYILKDVNGLYITAKEGE